MSDPTDSRSGPRHRSDGPATSSAPLALDQPRTTIGLIVTMTIPLAVLVTALAPTPVVLLATGAIAGLVIDRTLEWVPAKVADTSSLPTRFVNEPHSDT